jgi:hypothetical protein
MVVLLVRVREGAPHDRVMRATVHRGLLPPGGP